MPSVRQIRWAKFRVFVVTVVATTILIILFYLFTGGTLLESKVTLYVYVPDASGLAPGSPVRVNGISIGKVSAVDLSGSNVPSRIVRVAMRVEKRRLANIPVDSTADLAAETMLGEQFVAIRSGRSPETIAPGGEIPLKAQSASIDLKQFAQALRQVDETLRGIEEGTSPLGEFVVGEDMYNDLLRRVAQIQTGLESMGNTTSQIGGFLYTDKLLRQIEAPLLSLDQTLARIQSGQGPMGQLLRDSAQYDSLQASFADLRRSVASFRSSDLVQSDAMYTQLNRTLASLIQKVDEMNADPLFSSSAAYDNLNGFASEMQKTIREFRQNPRKFMRLKLP